MVSHLFQILGTENANSIKVSLFQGLINQGLHLHISVFLAFAKRLDAMIKCLTDDLLIRE